jgi:hypothetical protein
MQSHSDLIPRAEALRRIRELHAGIYRANCTPMTAAVGNMLGVVYSDIAAIPAIGTCATCEHWEQVMAFSENGDCMAEVYETSHGGAVETPPDHFCAAWKARDAK